MFKKILDFLYFEFIWINFRIASLSEYIAGKIDNLYARSKGTMAEQFIRAIRSRILYMGFPITSLLDSIYHGAIGAFKYYYRDKTKGSEQLDYALKHFLGFLGSPLGFINPRIVSFYFIPKRIDGNNIYSGGRVGKAKVDVKEPKTLDSIREIFAEAKKNDTKVTVRGAGLSQGYQYLPKDGGTVISMRHFNKIKICPDAMTAIVGAGATWGDIQKQANDHNLALQVMQASNVFQAGGSIGTNIHGWDHTAGTLANTLDYIKVLLPNGNVDIYHNDDPQFQKITGGFGLYGIIIEVQIRLVKNELLLENSHLVNIDEIANDFINNTKNNADARMYLCRLSLNPDNYFDEAVAVNYIKIDARPKHAENYVQEPHNGTRMQRILINFVRHFDWARRIYWNYEKKRLLNNRDIFTRNEVMQPPINAMFNNSVSEIEWLQEYFLPEKNISKFVKQLGTLLTTEKVRLINASVRIVESDKAFNTYTINGTRTYAVVLCFNQQIDELSIIKAKKWIRKATDLTLELGGKFYLPYQPYFSLEQFHKSYPRAKDLYAAKQELDPNAILSSQFSERYFAKTQNKNYFRELNNSKDLQRKFAGFLDNILLQVDKDKFFNELLPDVISYTDEQIESYAEIARRISEAKYNAIKGLQLTFKSLADIKEDLGNQARELIGDKQVNGMLEIGYPGRFINTFKQKLNLTGEMMVANFDNQGLMDYAQCGYPRPYAKFDTIDNFKPLDSNVFPNASVDVVTIFVGLHHIALDKVTPFLMSVRDVLRDNGNLLLVDHNITDSDTMACAHLAHSVYNAAVGFTNEDEANEIREFKPLEEWINILSQHGFSHDNHEPLVRHGDPTKNSMLRFTKLPASVNEECCRQVLRPGI